MPWVDLLSHDNQNTFKENFSNLTSDLVNKFLDPAGKFRIPSVSEYYKWLNLCENKFKIEKVQCQFWKYYSNLKPTKLPRKIVQQGGFLKMTQRHMYNFRPISLPPLISKIIERIIHDQTMRFYLKTMLHINFNQVSKNFSQQTLVCHASMIKSHKTSILVSWLELFLLIYKRQLIQLTTTQLFVGFTAEAIKWYTSYLSNTKFVVVVDKVSITCGVPDTVQFWVQSYFSFTSMICHRLLIVNYYYMLMILAWSSNTQI